jgi:outer membrane protein OmpA-like peptidoglycan-associated protein
VNKVSCKKYSKIKFPPEKELIAISDSIYSAQDRYYKYVKKKGFSVSFDNPTVYFDENCSTAKEIKDLYQVLGAMMKYKNMEILLTGTCDNNEFKTHPEVSKKRLNFIMSLLVKQGISKNRIEIEDVKNKQPVDHTGLGRQNRRVAVIFTKIE